MWGNMIVHESKRGGVDGESLRMLVEIRMLVRLFSIVFSGVLLRVKQIIF